MADSYEYYMIVPRTKTPEILTCFKNCNRRVIVYTSLLYGGLH
jgi:hypothetical protein